MVHHQQEIEGGWTVLGPSGEKIGSVDRCTESYCHIETGFVGLGPDYYVPRQYIRDVQLGEVHLSVPRDQLREMGWRRPPAEAGPAGTAPPGEQGVTAPRPSTGPVEETPRPITLNEDGPETRKQEEVSAEVSVAVQVEERVRRIRVPASAEEAAGSAPAGRPPPEAPAGEGEGTDEPAEKGGADR